MRNTSSKYYFAKNKYMMKYKASFAGRAVLKYKQNLWLFRLWLSKMIQKTFYRSYTFLRRWYIFAWFLFGGFLTEIQMSSRDSYPTENYWYSKFQWLPRYHYISGYIFERGDFIFTHEIWKKDNLT